MAGNREISIDRYLKYIYIHFIECIDSIDSSSVLFEALGQLQKYSVFGRFANRICQKPVLFGLIWSWCFLAVGSVFHYFNIRHIKIYKGNPLLTEVILRQ